MNKYKRDVWRVILAICSSHWTLRTILEANIKAIKLKEQIQANSELPQHVTFIGHIYNLEFRFCFRCFLQICQGFQIFVQISFRFVSDLLQFCLGFKIFFLPTVGLSILRFGFRFVLHICLRFQRFVSDFKDPVSDRGSFHPEVLSCHKRPQVTTSVFTSVFSHDDDDDDDAERPQVTKWKQEIDEKNTKTSVIIFFTMLKLFTFD